MQKIEIGQHLVIDPEICSGQMTFKGTRVTVDVVFVYLAKGYSIDMLLQSWPQLSRVAVKEAIDLAAQAFLKNYEITEEVISSIAS